MSTDKSLKDLVKLPFTAFDGRLDADGGIITINIAFDKKDSSDDEQGEALRSVVFFVEAAANEKAAREWGVLERWEAFMGYNDNGFEHPAIRCPKCATERLSWDAKSDGYNYCPSCGVKLDPSEVSNDV